MGFLDEKHRERIALIDTLWKGIEALSALAREYGIDDIFQDNGAKILQQLIYMNFQGLKAREGNDAVDEFGTEWELKSANEAKVVGVSTHHHLNHVILKKYRSVPWMFAIYHHTALKEIYCMAPLDLEPVFQQWEQKLIGEVKNGKKLPPRESLNNPKIPIGFIRKNGVLVYPYPEKPVNPASVGRVLKKEKVTG